MDPLKTPARTRNILNVESVDKYCESLGRDQPPHIQAWFRSTFRSWMLNESATAKPVFYRKSIPANLLILADVLCQTLTDSTLNSVLDKLVHEVDYASQPEWAKSVLDSGGELFYIPKPKRDDRVMVHHWLDYMATLPEKPMRQTVDAMKIAVAEWDEMLKNQKIRADAFKGYVLMNLKCLKNTEWKLYELTTREAHKYEGRVMNHCVGSYSISNQRIVYSLMKGDHHEITLEAQRSIGGSRKLPIRKTTSVAVKEIWTIVQAMSNSNQVATAEQQAILDQIYKELHFRVNLQSDEDDEEDEEDEEDDDGEDDEEDVVDEEDEEYEKAQRLEKEPDNDEW